MKVAIEGKREEDEEVEWDDDEGSCASD